ncbi:MAG: nuclear transport factor 2 family protein [Janthinobacterium lividum]
MATADEIRSVLEAKAEALVARQASHLDDLIHHDFVYINAGGRTFDKAGYIEAYCTSGRVVFTQQRIADLMVKLIDGFAIATFSINDELRIDGRVVNGRYRSLCVFSQPSGRWLWTAGQTMTAGDS